MQADEIIERYRMIMLGVFVALMAIVLAETILLGTAVSFFTGGFAMFLSAIYMYNTYWTKYYRSFDHDEAEKLRHTSRKFQDSCIFAIAYTVVVTISATLEFYFEGEVSGITIVIMLVLWAHFFYLTFEW